MMQSDKIKSLLLTLACSMLASACMFQQEDLFDESASNRATHFNEDLQTRLVEQSQDGKQGWVIQYFVDDRSIEGFNLFGRFAANNCVTLAGNHRYLRGGEAGNFTECNSSYQMLLEEGPVLSFNTWNDVLTVFADPVSPASAPTQIEDDGVGMHGDYNLSFTKFDGESIVFRGERYGSEVRFIPCDRPWQTYLDDVEAMRKRITNSTLREYYLVHGTDTAYYVSTRSGILIHRDRPEDPMQEEPLSCVFTPDGLRLHRVDTLSNASFQQFRMAEDNSRLTSEDGQVQLVPAWDRYVSAAASQFKIPQESFTDEQASLFTQMGAEAKAAKSTYVLDSIVINRIEETEVNGGVTEKVKYGALMLCIHAPGKMGRTQQFKPYVYIDISRPVFGKLKISQSPVARTSEVMSTIFGTTNLKSLAEQFAATLYGAYDMQPDDCFRPTRVTLQPETPGGNAIVLNLRKIVDW